MKVGIFSKVDKFDNQGLKEFTERLKFNKTEYFYLDEKDEKPDLIAVFGGDGTILLAVDYAIRYNSPIVSLNAGTVGFLTDFECVDAVKVADLICENKLKFTQRSLLSVSIEGKIFNALNDIVIESDRSVTSSSVISKLSVDIEDTHVYDLNSDGVIVSTPTGSTAYSLSAGGVILSPDLNSFILTPICSHSLATRPIVYSENKSVKIMVRKNSSDCILCVDGRVVAKLKPGDKIEISKSDKTVATLVDEQNFFSKIYFKLGN